MTSPTIAHRTGRAAAPAAARGALAGVAATAVMTAVMAALNHALHAEQPKKPDLAPRKVAVGLARKAGASKALGPGGRTALTWITHFGFGMAAAALFPLATKRLPGGPVVRGVAWGLFVWAASYAGWIPALGILPPPKRRPRRQNVVTILAHVVWGATLGALAPGRPRFA